jgi:biofilm PGA synthesis protein PgaA
VSLTLDNDYLTYRHYDTAFHQKLAVSVGNYWQQSYGSNIVGNVQYEHRWQVANRFELSYGGIRGYHYYDDGLTKSWTMYLTTDLRF